jgi:hypothetical protein
MNEDDFQSVFKTHNDVMSVLRQESNKLRSMVTTTDDQFNNLSFWNPCQSLSVKAGDLESIVQKVLTMN